jgi:hypothetical protein
LGTTSLGGVILVRDVDRPTIEQIAAQENPFILNSIAEFTITTIAPGRVDPDLNPVPRTDR